MLTKYRHCPRFDRALELIGSYGLSFLVALAFAWALNAHAQAPAKPPATVQAPAALDELSAAKIEALMYRKALIENQHAAVRAELDRLISEAAKKAGVDPKTHTPDVGAKTWVPVKP